MKIAQVAPLTESVSPKTYGGIERVVSYLTEELVSQGHDVTLFASGDSITNADHVAVVDRSLRLSEQEHDALVWHMRQIMEVIRMADRFDIIHFSAHDGAVFAGLVYGQLTERTDRRPPASLVCV